MDFVEFWTILSANNIILTTEQIALFKRYYSELIYWNDKVNLISRQDNDVLEKHFIHCLSILKYMELKPKARCLDIGTGGGFPGLVLKIARPDLYMILSDSIKKKMTLTKMFAQHTELQNIECRLGNVAEMKSDKRYVQHFDYIFARAVAETDKLMELSLPLLKANGKYVLLKGGDLSEELNKAKKQFPKFVFETQKINMSGCEWLNEAEKKIVIISTLIAQPQATPRALLLH